MKGGRVVIGRGSLRALVVIGIVLSLVLCPLRQPPATLAVPPSATNPFPSDGANEVSLTPTLHADFGDADGDDLVESEWQIGGSTFPGSAADLTSCHVSAGLLTYSTPYDWRVSFTDNAGESYVSPVWSFTTMAEPQATSVTTEAATDVETASATLNGILSSMGTASTVTVSFQWGTSDSYENNESAGTMTGEGGFSASLSGLAPETTYHFRAVATSDDGADEGNDLTFTTGAAATQAPSVTTEAATDVETASATLNGILSSMGTASSVAVSFHWGTSDSHGNTESAGTMTGEGGFSASLSGLAPNTTYHFRAVAVAGGLSDDGADLTFTTDALQEAPSVTTSEATAEETTTATLNGNLGDTGTAASVQVYFEWGLTTGYGSPTTPASMASAGAFSADLTGLTAGTTYHFCAVATSDDGIDYGDDRTFTTSAAPTEAPAVATAAASGIGTISAELNLTLTDMGTATSVQVSFQWGQTTGYGYTTPAQAMDDAGSLSYAVTGLAPETTYHYRAVAVGDGTAYGNDLTFTTAALPEEPAEVTTTAASAIGTSSATLGLNLASLGSAASVEVYLEWGPTTAYGSATTRKTVSRTGASSFAISGLTPATTYHFRAVVVGDGTAYGSDLTFTTVAADPVPPAVTTADAASIGTNSATLNLSLAAVGTAAAVQVSFEWGPTADYGQTTEAVAMSGPGSLSQPVSGLAAATTYHFRAVAVGDGTAYGGDLTFSTGSTPPVAPRVKTGDPDSVTGTSARLNGELSSLGTAASVTVSFAWGTAPGGPYLNQTQGTARTDSGTFYFDLDGLAPGTVYYFRAMAVGDGNAMGVEKSFVTVGQAPRIDSLTAYSSREGDPLTVKITGANLSSATRVDLGQGIRVVEFTVVSDSEIRARIEVESGAESVVREVTVTTPSGIATHTVPAGFLAGFSGESAKEDGPRVRLWVYTAVIGVVAVVSVLVALELWLNRRSDRRRDE